MTKIKKIPKIQGKLQVEGNLPYIYSVMLFGKTIDDIMTACKPYRYYLKECRIAKDPKDRTVYVFLDDKTVIRAYFWFI